MMQFYNREYIQIARPRSEIRPAVGARQPRIFTAAVVELSAMPLPAHAALASQF